MRFALSEMVHAIDEASRFKPYAGVRVSRGEI